jgi:hypothetical protein
MEACGGAHYWARQFRAHGHTGFFGESEKFRALACPTRRQAGAMPPSLGHS